jgi:uncharacterized protein YggE
MDATMPTKGSKGFTLDFRVIIGALLLIIAGMLLMWKPWQPQFDANARTISVTGQAKITAAPDEYIFTPSYDFKNASRESALSDLSKKSDEIVAKLKQLGVADSKIKTNSDGYDYPIYGKGDTSTPTYSLRLTVTINDKDLAQKVQDYLVTTAPTGAVSPQITFSDTKRKELESQARDQATKDARTKAEQSAKNLGFSLGSIKSVNDGASFGGIYPVLQGGTSGTSEDTSSKLSLQPGENDLTYQVSVVYFVK